MKTSKTDTELLNRLVGEWKKKSKQAEANLKGTQLERMHHRFSAQMQVYDDCAIALQETINTDSDYQKAIEEI